MQTINKPSTVLKGVIITLYGATIHVIYHAHGNIKFSNCFTFKTCPEVSARQGRNNNGNSVVQCASMFQFSVAPL